MLFLYMLLKHALLFLTFYVAPDRGRANGIAKGKGILVLKHRN